MSGGASAAAGDDEPLAPENAPHGRAERERSCPALQVVGDRRRAGVMALSLELAAHLNDRLDDLGRLPEGRSAVFANGARAPRIRPLDSA